MYSHFQSASSLALHWGSVGEKSWPYLCPVLCLAEDSGYELCTDTLVAEIIEIKYNFLTS